MLELVTGLPLLTSHRGMPVAVWYWNGEDPLEEIQRRIQAACFHYKITEAELGGRLFVDSGRDMPLAVVTEERFETRIAVPVVDRVEQKIIENDIAAVFIDPFIRCHRVSENNNNAINSVIEQWARIADRSDSATDLVHHIRKIGNTEADVDDGRGAGAMKDGVRHARVLNHMTAADAGLTDVDPDERKRYVNVTNGKANLSPPSAKRTWFFLESVELGNGDGLTDGDHVGVAVPWQWPSPFDDMPTGTLEAFQNRLGIGQWRADQRADKWAGKLLADCLGWDVSQHTVKKQLGQILETWGKTGAIHKVKGRDEKRNPREFYEKMPRAWVPQSDDDD